MDKKKKKSKNSGNGEPRERELRPEFMLGEAVRHRLNKNVGILTGIMIRPNGFVYYVTFPDMAEKGCYSLELSRMEGDKAPPIGFDKVPEVEKGMIGFGCPEVR